METEPNVPTMIELNPGGVAAHYEVQVLSDGRVTKKLTLNGNVLDPDELNIAVMAANDIILGSYRNGNA